MNDVLVSVCVPTANRSEFLEKSLRGILSQEYKNLEILIGDNASTDGTRELCLRLAKTDSRIRYIRREKNIGIYPNHNGLIGLSRGEYICFLHDDDEFDPSLIHKEAAFLERHPEAGLVAPDWNLIDEAGKSLGARDHKVPGIQNGLRFIEQTLRSGQSCVGLSGTMVRRSALGACRFDENGPIGFSDFVLWFEIAEQSAIGHIPERLYSYRLHTRSLSKRPVLSITRDYRQAMSGYCDGHLKRWPAREKLVRKWRAKIRHYLFWMLAYEICLHFSRALKPGEENRRYRTVFELMNYHLTEEEFQEALAQFRRMEAGPVEKTVRGIIRFLLLTRCTWPLGQLVPHAPALRGLLRLQ